MSRETNRVRPSGSVFLGDRFGFGEGAVCADTAQSAEETRYTPPDVMHRQWNAVTVDVINVTIERQKRTVGGIRVPITGLPVYRYAYLEYVAFVSSRSCFFGLFFLRFFLIFKIFSHNGGARRALFRIKTPAVRTPSRRDAVFFPLADSVLSRPSKRRHTRCAKRPGDPWVFCDRRLPAKTTIGRKGNLQTPPPLFGGRKKKRAQCQTESWAQGCRGPSHVTDGISDDRLDD